MGITNLDRIFASIITIGDELLIGQVVDTNSAWMAASLNRLGVWLKRRVSVGDNPSDIIKALDAESAEVHIVLITGGLGPTADDITKPVLCDYFGGNLIVDEGALQNVKDIFARLNRPLLEVNQRQAEVPDNCTVIPNKKGTAPGMWFEKNGKVFVSMPGVPHEMKGMMEDFVLPRLPGYFRMPSIMSKTLLTAGIGESFLAEMIGDFENSLPAHIKLAYLPNVGMVRLRLTGTGPDEDSLAQEISTLFEMLKKLVERFLVTDEDEALHVAVGKLLLQNGSTVGTAESCTGGYIAHLLSAEPGSSGFFKGSVVSYANEIKQEVLQVPANILETAGAVSEETVRYMAEGALAVLGTDYVVAVSGIMGPAGGSAAKPVGLVWIAVAGKGRLQTEQYSFRFDRRRNIELTATTALNLLRKFIISVNENN